MVLSNCIADQGQLVLKGAPSHARPSFDARVFRAVGKSQKGFADGVLVAQKSAPSGNSNSYSRAKTKGVC